ncbi:6-phosphogluconate dehydrogenase, decarboxylating [subsurface metagenome]
MVKKADIGIIGLGVMGQNLALNMERNGFRVAGFDIDEEKIRLAKRKFTGKNIVLISSIKEMVDAVRSPKKFLMMVPAGVPVDAVIQDIKTYLVKGDILIDGGNSFFKDTISREKELEKDGIFYMGTGISGGEEGALYGPSIMPGGALAAWKEVKELLQSIAAKTDDGFPCCDWIGENGAGHFAKMVHNGIEYGDMQLICEAYQIMKVLLGMSPDEMYGVFKEWNEGELNSYLIEITRDIMDYKDEDGKPLIDKILDTAGQKGTGKWTGIAALEMCIPLTLIGEAVFARCLSALKEERVSASKVIFGPTPKFEGNKEVFIEDLRKGLHASKIISYAQGFTLLNAASVEYNWNFNYGTIASIWRNGCIIRSIFLGKIKEAFDRDPNLTNLLLDPFFKERLTKSQDAWRRIVSIALANGIPVPAFSSALCYFDGYRTERLPANLLQAQRDYFGAHTYERVDKLRGEYFHTNWTGRGGTTVSTTYTL